MHKQSDYIYPHISTDDMYDKPIQHRVNFFGEDGLYTIKERIAYALDINQSVWRDGCGFYEDIINLFDKPIQDIVDGQYVSMHKDSIKNTNIDKLSCHMLRTDPTIHHIIFQNNCLGGHKKNKPNHKEMERGVHTSFHELLDNKNLYPHQQLTKIIKLEKDTINPHIYSTLKEIQDHYHQIFVNDPSKIYRKDVFQEAYYRKYIGY